MDVKIDEIINKISEIRAFTDDSYLKTTRFVLFLLFGCSDEIKQIIEQRAWEIIVDKKAVAFLSVENLSNISTEVEAAVDHVSTVGALDKLIELHFCPFIISDAAEPKSLTSTMESLETYKRNNALIAYWKPFIILNTQKPSADEWLSVIAGEIQALAGSGVSTGCRCCVMTRKDENGIAITVERLINTVLFVAFLHANESTAAKIGERIAYRYTESPNDLFYTAQTVFISNPVTTRTLNCVVKLLDNIDTGSEERDLDFTFATDALDTLYAKLPREKKQVTLTPLYGVMPDLNGNAEEYRTRLRDFSRKHYRSKIDINKADFFERFRSGLVRAFIA